jgi:dihydropteroate synthase
MGIVNVTPDSFSDGERFYATEKAVQHAWDLIAEGADIIDVGGESTRPGADPVSEEEEMRRVLPVIEKLAERIRVPISVDTTKATVARRAIEAGASIVNDVSAMRFDPRMVEVVRRAGSGLVLMHMKGSPQTMQRSPAYRSLMGDIFHFLSGRVAFALSRGIRAGQIVVDPGIGFGKTGRHNLEILHRLSELRPLGRPILVGPSRKAFIGKLLDLPPADRLEGTTAAVAAAVLGGARLIRVHDVAATARVAKVAEAIRREKMTGTN